MWERYSDAELAVILNFLADAAERLRGRTEALAASGIHLVGDEGRRTDAARRDG